MIFLAPPNGCSSNLIPCLHSSCKCNHDFNFKMGKENLCLQVVWVCLVVSDSSAIPGTDCSSLSSSVIGFSRILEWVAISFSRTSSGPKDQTQVSCGSYLGRWGFFFCLFFVCLFVLLLSHLGRHLREIPAKLIHIYGKINGLK